MRNILLLLSVLFLSTLGHLATDIYLPSMPSICDYFGTTTNLVQLTFSVYLLSFCLTPLVAGPISDSIGRKRPIFVGIFLSLIATLMCALSSHIYIFIFSRFLQGIGLGIVVSAARAILPDNFKGKQLGQYYSYMSMLFPLILAIGPSLGGIIQDNSTWQMVFVFMLFYLSLMLVLVKNIDIDGKKPALSKQKLNVAAEFRLYFRIYQSLLKNKSFMLFTGCSILIFMGITSYLVISPFLFQSLLGLSPTEFGLLSVGISCAVFISGFINSRLINIIHPKKLLYFGNAFIFLSGFLLVGLNQLALLNDYTLFMCILIFFCAVPISFANATSLALKNVKENFGAAMALASCLQFLGGAISSFLITLASTNIERTLGLTFIMVSISYFLVLYCEGLRSPMLEEGDKTYHAN